MTAIPPTGTRALRGPALTFTGDPIELGTEAAMRHESDALVVLSGGKITNFGPASAVRAALPPGTTVEETGRSTLILPGFVDCHAHYPQTEIVGAGGGPLVQWLERHVFPAEQRFTDAEHARSVARVYLAECLRAGTTTAAVFCTVHPQSVDAFFEEASALGLRAIAGKVLMDRNAPAALTDTAQRGYDESQALVARWHGRGRLSYAVTPRFAPSSTEEQLELAGALWAEHPGTYLQSHVSETRDEVAWVRSLYPRCQGYLDVYEQHGLLGPRAIHGHGIWLTEEELVRLHATGTALAHCPTSNAFLGSGTFDLARATRRDRPVRVGLGTDIGAGTSFSMLRTMGAAYEAAARHGNLLSAVHAFYLATRGGAQALRLDDRIGSLEPGMEADLVVLDLESTPLLAHRMRRCESLEDVLFLQMTLGDERAVLATYVAGEPIHRRGGAGPTVESPPR